MTVYHIKAPTLPRFRFEWHAGRRNVYMVEDGGRVAEVIAFDVPDRGAAVNAVLVWCRGYRRGQTQTIAPGLVA